MTDVTAWAASLGALAVAAGACGRFARTPWPAALSSIACAGAGFGVAVSSQLGFGSTVAAIIIGPMAAFSGYSTGKRTEMVHGLAGKRWRVPWHREASASGVVIPLTPKT